MCQNALKTKCDGPALEEEHQPAPQSKHILPQHLIFMSSFPLPHISLQHGFQVGLWASPRMFLVVITGSGDRAAGCYYLLCRQERPGMLLNVQNSPSQQRSIWPNMSILLKLRNSPRVRNSMLGELRTSYQEISHRATKPLSVFPHLGGAELTGAEFDRKPQSRGRPLAVLPVK